MDTSEKPNPTVAFVSLGCVKNLVDSEKMLGLLAEDGLLPHPDPEEADVLVVNTCAFIEDSKRESMDAVRQALVWKRAGKGRRVVVAGCMAQRYGAQIVEQAPGVDAMVGVFERDKIVDACRTALDKPEEKPVKGRKFIPLPMRSNREAKSAEPADGYQHWTTRSSVLLQQADSHPTAPAARKSRTTTGFWLGGDVTTTGSDLARIRLTPPHYAYLRISEGCDKRCTFCIIPHIRGDLVSKPGDDVLAEARELVADGAKELVVVGQNTTSYGKDVNDKAGMAGLLRRLARETDAEWLRLMYVYPANFYSTLIDVMAEEPKVLRYVDMPLQHANDRMLKAMKRGVGKARIEKLLTELRARVPGVVIRTTFIVGFPGETEAEFAELVEFVKTHKFERVGVFTYSHEEGTEAASLPGAIPEDVKQARREALMLAAQEVAFAHVREMIGKTLSVRIDARAEEPPAGAPKAKRGESWWVGRYYGQAPEVDSVVYVRDRAGELEPGRLLDCRVTAGAGYDLMAESVSPQSESPTVRKSDSRG